MAKFERSKPQINKDIAVSGLKYVVPPNLTFNVSVEFDDKIFKQIKDDGILLEDMGDEIDKIYTQTCNSIKSKLNAFEKLAAVMVDKNAPPAELKKQLDGLNKSIEQDKDIAKVACEQAVTQCWKTYSAKKKEYLKYKIKIVAKIIGAAAALATSIALTASTPFTGGLSAAVSIVGMVKSTVTIGKEVASAWMEVETANKVLAKNLKVVEAACKKVAKKKANEYTAMLFDQFLGISQPCIKTCVSQMDVCEQKLNGIEIKTHDASKKLNKILDEQETMRAAFMKEVTEKLSQHSSPKAKDQIKLIEKRLDALLAGSYTAVQKQIETTTNLHKRFKAADKTLTDLRPRVEEIKKLKSLDEKIVANLLVLIDFPLGALNGNVFAKESMDLVNGLVPVATSFAYDKLCSKVLDGTFLA
jgi:DNA repair exonuclease SbcCD ATPase subunit